MIKHDMFIVHKLLLSPQSDPIRKSSRIWSHLAPTGRGGDGRAAKLEVSKRQQNCSSPSAAGSVPGLEFVTTVS